jgi:hypothetical protein
LFNDDTGGLLQDAVNEFMTQPEEVQKQYLDRNKNGVIDESEIELAQQMGTNVAAFASNPIVKWAMDTKGQRYQTSRPQVSNPPSNYGFQFGTSKNFQPGVKRQGAVSYGDQTYNDVYDFDGSYKLRNIPTHGARKLGGTASSEPVSNKNIEGYLKHYVADRDAFIISTVGAGNVGGTEWEIPASNLTESEINTMPLYDNGYTTVGKIRGNRPAAQASGDWSEFKRK